MSISDTLPTAMLSICYSKFEIAMMKNYLEMSPEAKQGFKTFLKEIAPTIEAEADEGIVAEGPAGYKTVENTSNVDTTAKELHELIDEMYDAKAGEPSA